MQLIKYLGFEIDLEDYSLKLPKEKQLKIRKIISGTLSVNKHSARQMAHFAGNIIALSNIFGGLTRLMTRFSYQFIGQQFSWDRKSIVPLACKKEMFFWQITLRKPCLKKFLGYRLPKALVWSDASATGAGGILKAENVRKISSLVWSPSEISQSSTFRELRAIELCLSCFGKELKNTVAKFFTDNFGAMSIVKNGSSKPFLQSIAMRIYWRCVELGLTLEIEWIPREENVVADWVSKNPDWDDWAVENWVFHV